MPDVRLTTDMGDWSTLPRRIRLAIVSLVVGASVVGIAAGIGVLSITAAAVLLSALGVVFVVFLDRRRAWWPEEPTLAVDPVGANLPQKVVVFGAIGVGAALLGLIGVLST
jgi:hypothetical protein